MWTSLGIGTNGPVHALAFSSDGTLYVEGVFGQAYDAEHTSGLSTKKIAKWDTLTSRWSALGGGIDSHIVYGLGIK